VAPWRSQALKLRPGRCIVKYVNHQDGGALDRLTDITSILTWGELLYSWSESTGFRVTQSGLLDTKGRMISLSLKLKIVVKLFCLCLT
jgi:hypothetical protein